MIIAKKTAIVMKNIVHTIAKAIVIVLLLIAAGAANPTHTIANANIDSI